MTAVYPYEIQPEPVQQYRIEGHRGIAHRLLGVADSSHVELMVAAFGAAMRGWRITTRPVVATSGELAQVPQTFTAE